MNIALLINSTDNLELDNYYLFTPKLLSHGHSVTLCFIDSLGMRNNQVTAQGYQITSELPPIGKPFTELQSSPVVLNTLDLVWILALGYRKGFLDKIQLLHNLEQDTRITNTINAILFLKSKYYLSARPDIFPHPESHAAANWEQLYHCIQAAGGTWIIKPPAGSFGRDVFKVHASDANLKALLQNMTGYDNSQYCLIERYIEEIQEGEKRVLFANGEVIGQYSRINGSDHRTNMAQGANAHSCQLTTQEKELCQRVGQTLCEEGALFAAMDLAYPYVIELNVINPGGLSTIQTLSGEDLSGIVIDKVLASFN